MDLITCRTCGNIIVVHQGEIKGESVSRGRCSSCHSLIEIETHIVTPSDLSPEKLKTVNNRNR